MLLFEFQGHENSDASAGKLWSKANDGHAPQRQYLLLSDVRHAGSFANKKCPGILKIA